MPIWLWYPAVGLSYWLELEMINGLTMQGVGSERSWSFQVELSLLYFCENFSHCFSTALSHHFAPPQTHTHMYTHMVQFSAIEHISCVSYCAEVCAHIFQHQYGRKLSSLFFFPLVNLNNATLQLLGGGALPVPNTGKSRWKKPFINVKVAAVLQKRTEVNSLSTAAQPTRYWDRNTPAGSLWELHCLFLISLQCFYWNVCPQVSASPVFFHSTWGEAQGWVWHHLSFFLNLSNR